MEKEKAHKYSAFVSFNGTSSGKMEFSNSIKRLQKLILVPDVTKVIILNGLTGKKIQTLKNKFHI